VRGTPARVVGVLVLGAVVAKDLDSLGTTLRQAASGNLQSPDSSSLISSGRKLQTACNS
jgi:hypothetical protein